MSRILHHVGRNDFKKTRQRQIGEQKERAAQKLKECQEAEAERKQIEEAAKPYKSNWREETQLQESDWTPVKGSIANSTSQTFQYSTSNFETGEPNTVTVSGLGGAETAPSETIVDFGFGEKFPVPAPDFSQVGLQGYAPPLGGVQRQTQQTENERIDAEIRKLEEQIKQLGQKISNLNEKQKASEPKYTGMTNDQFIDRKNEINNKWNEKTGPLGEIIYGSSSESERMAAYAKYYEYEDARREELDALDAEYKSQSDSHSKKLEDHFNAYSKKFDSLRKEQNALYAKIAELEKQRPINQQLDASQQAYPNLPMMNARVQPSPPAGTLQNPLFWDIEAYDKLTLAQKDAVLKAYERNLKNSTPPPALRDYRNTSPLSPAMGANLGTARRIMMDYLTKDWDNRVVADNEYLGRDYIDNQFFKNVTFDTDGTYVGGSDAVVGTGQPPRVDPKTGEIVVRANFDFNKNEYEAIGDPEKQEFAQRLKRFGGMSDYALDAIVDGLPGNLGTLAGMFISPFIAGSKSMGRGNNIPIVIRFTPQELKRKNKKQYDQLVRMGLIKESTFDKIKKYR